MGSDEWPVPATHRAQVESLLSAGAAEHAQLLEQLPDELRHSLPVDAQGLTRAIDHLAGALGLSDGERRTLLRPHALNPAVMHARVFGRAPMGRETVIASFVDGARVRADALSTLADLAGGQAMGEEVREILVAHPPPLAGDREAVSDLRGTYQAQERAAIVIARALDARPA